MYLVRPCLNDDIPAVDEFFSSILYKEEPLVSVNGPHVIPRLDESLSAAVIPQGHSIVAESVNGTIIGVSLNDEPPQVFPSIYTNTIEDNKFREMFQYIDKMSEIDDLAPDALEIRLMAVREEWRKKGVASAILRATESSARAANIKWLKIYCTSHYSTLLVEKLSWKKIYTLNYKEYLNNFPSDIKIPEEPHTQCDVFVKMVNY